MDNQTFKSWAGKGPVGLCESNKPDAQMSLLKVIRGQLLSLHVTAHIPVQFQTEKNEDHWAHFVNSSGCGNICPYSEMKWTLFSNSKDTDT